MKKFPKFSLILFAGLAIFLSAQACEAQQLFVRNSFQSEPTWYPYIIARGETRTIIENTPIEFRPYRPMHFYGNTVRRSYYRGNPVPMPGDFARGTITTMRRR